MTRGPSAWSFEQTAGFALIVGDSGHMHMCIYVCVWVLTAGQVRAGLKPCVLCQARSTSSFRIDELPAFLIKPSVTSQQNTHMLKKGPGAIKSSPVDATPHVIVRRICMCGLEVPGL